MRSAVIGALLLASPLRAQLSPGDKTFDIPFPGDCGLVTRYASDRIPTQCLTEALNLLLDEDATISRREGRSKYNATACTGAQSVRGLWRFRATDGTDYLVILSSQALLWNGIGLMSLLAENRGESEWKILVELDPH